MKISLKTRLIISYAGLSIMLVFSLFVISNNLIKKQFNIYIQDKQEQKNLDIVQTITSQFETGQPPSMSVMKAIGENALKDGIILTIKDINENKIFCMDCFDSHSCDNMINSVVDRMNKLYPNFKGEYTEKTYILSKDSVNYGTVTIGFYGPFYYNESDLIFIEMLNKMFFVVTLIFLIFAFLIGFFISGKIVEPIKAVISKTHDIEKGNYENRIPFSSNTTELEEMINSINKLACSLETQYKLKKRMAQDYAHEFRTPLAALQLNLEGMIDGVIETSNERMEIMRQEVLRLTRMISDIDKIDELQNNIENINKENFCFLKLVKHNINAFEAQIKEKNINLKVEGQDCYIYGDKDKISSVIINLISNAVKYSDYNGLINITVTKQNNNIEFAVHDTGIGISEADLPYIFDHLYRADMSRARKTGGSGIGLSVVKAIVNAHLGTIEVESKLGIGSTFTVKIPEK